MKKVTDFTIRQFHNFIAKKKKITQKTIIVISNCI